LLLGLPTAGAQGSAESHPSSQHSAGKPDDKNNTSEIELSKRALAANAAKESGDPAAVAQANSRLIAMALRLMGQVRLIEAAPVQAAELYQDSLTFEDVPDARADLAVSEIEAGQFDDAIVNAERVLAVDPDNLQAERALGSAWMNKGDYSKAAQALSKVVQLKADFESMYSLGICLLTSADVKDKQRAAAVFQQVEEITGDNASLHVLFGRAYRDAGDMLGAIREFQGAIRLDTTAPHAHYFLGLARLSMNDWKPTPEAKAEIQKELLYHPNDFLANYMLGFLASAERQYEEADHYLRKAAKLDPTWPEPSLYMGLNAYAQGDMKLSEEMLRNAVALTGNDEARSNYQIRRAYVELGRILTSSGRKDEGEVFLTKARDLQNKIMRQTQQDVASMTAAAGGGMAATVAPLDRKQENEQAPGLQQSAGAFARVDAAALAKSKLTPAERNAANARENELRTVLGLAFSDLATSEALRGDYAKALSHYQQAEHWDTAVPTLYKNLGQSAFRAGDYAEAIRGLSKALEQKPDAGPLRAMLGMSYFATDKYAEAASTFAPLGRNGMTDGETGYAWAASLTHLGDNKKASEVLSEFQSAPRSNEILLLSGQLWTEIGDFSRSVATFSQVLQSNPSQAKGHFYSGLAYIRWEHWPEAAQEFQQELALYPGEAEAQYHLGFVYMQQSRIPEATNLFQQIVAAHPEHANAHYQLGKILLDRGQTADAVTHFEVAARLSPQTDYLHYQLQAAYRKEGRISEADHELEIYKQIKAKSRERIAEATKANR